MSIYNYSENPGYALRMEAFDTLPPSVRADINENGPKSLFVYDYICKIGQMSMRKKKKNGV